MGREWLHCNSCSRLPAQRSEFQPYYFATCGHLICRKCITAGTSDSCQICHKAVSFVEINRNIRPELQMLFRNPKDLLDQYAKNLKTVIEFQNSHRHRLLKLCQEQQKKAMKFVVAARTEIRRRIENEKKSDQEKELLVSELEKLRNHCQILETALSSMQNRTPVARAPSSSLSRNGAISSLTRSGQTPFNFIATSTPISDIIGHSGCMKASSTSSRLASVFAANSIEPSPIANDVCMLTPDMLGFKKNVDKYQLVPKRSGPLADTEAYIF